MELSFHSIIVVPYLLLLISHTSTASFVGVDTENNVVMSASEGKNVRIIAGAGGSIVLNSVDVLKQQALLAQQFNVMNQSLAQMQILFSSLNKSNFNLQSQVTSLQSIASLQNQMIGDQQLAIALQNKSLIQVPFINQSLARMQILFNTTNSNLQSEISSLGSAVTYLQSIVSLQSQTIVDQELSIGSLNKTIQALKASSCSTILEANASAVSGVYTISNGFGSLPVWCEMIDGVAWTLVLKVDGTLSTFYNDSPLWNNSATLNEPIIDGHDNTEYKSTMYSIMPFTQLLLGMRDPSAPFNTTRWVPMDYTAISLLDVLIRPGTTVTPTPNRTQAFYLGGPETQLQDNCNLAGFNLIPVYSLFDGVFLPNTFHVRIGFFANEQNDCGSPDSFVGFGGSYEKSLFDLACGSALQSPLSSFVSSFGYILAR